MIYDIVTDYMLRQNSWLQKQNLWRGVFTAVKIILLPRDLSLNNVDSCDNCTVSGKSAPRVEILAEIFPIKGL